MAKGFDPGAELEAGTRAEGGRDRRSAARGAKLVAAALAAGVLVAFAAANFRPVEVNFLLFTSRARVVTVIAVSALLGFLVGWLAGRPSRAERRALRRALEERD
ncbi:MAG: hypothetical protein KatS3mg014_0153 [Actinomycetota bacterium]|nr:MAG: hypothetical protein KatS3mg014_0153 [Actinomycetota bacterium]